MASTKVSGVLVYTVISDVDVQSSLEQTADSQSAAETYANLQKEAETFLSSIVTNLPDKGILAFTTAGRCNVYTLISDIDVQSSLGNAADSESAALVATDLQKEAEIFLSSIVLQMPEKGISVITEGLLASTKPSSENVYSIISKLETEEKHSLLGDDQSPSIIRTELQKEAKSYFSSVLEDLPAEALTRLTPEDWFDQVGRHGDGVW